MIVPSQTTDLKELERECVALCNIRGNEGLSIIETLLRGDLDFYRVGNDDADGKQLLQQQGACQYIVRFLDRIEGARDTLGRLRK